MRRTALLFVLIASSAGLAISACGGDDETSAATGEAADTESELEEPVSAAWGYSGDEGPANWGSLDPEYEACSDGSRQSPIELADAESGAPPAIEFSYEPEQVEVTNNGHTLDAEFPPGSSIVVERIEYELEQIHFHSPGEHLVDGRPAAMEFHAVHQAEDSTAVALGILVEEGRENPAFAPLLEALPTEQGETIPVPGTVDPLALLPPRPDSAPRWSYQGSLTTPPCSEVVLWSVFMQPVELSAEQIADYRAVYDDNNRPAQTLGDRELLLGR